MEPITKVRHSILTVLAVLAFASCSEPTQIEHFSLKNSRHPFVPVMIDDADASAYGGLPLDRAIIASAVRNAARSGARGIVLKFFFDRESNPQSDSQLAGSLEHLPVYLQATMKPQEAEPNPLPKRFSRNSVQLDSFAPLTGQNGWVPLPTLSENAEAVGFVDVADPHTVPAYVEYRGTPYPSLTLLSLEMAVDGKASLTSDGNLRLSGQELRLDRTASFRIQLPKTEPSSFVSFQSLADGQLPEQSLEGKIVIIGYDGSKIPKISTEMGSVKAHRLFYYGLVSSYLEIIGRKK